MGVNSLPKTVTRHRRGCDLNPGPSAPESSMLTTLPASNRWTTNYTFVDKLKPLNLTKISGKLSVDNYFTKYITCHWRR